MNAAAASNFQTHDDAEEEIEQEEKELENELRAALANALDADDLLEDEDEDSAHKTISNLSQDLNNTADDRSELSWQLDMAPDTRVAALAVQQTSTPRNADTILPALKTPATIFQQYYNPTSTSQSDPLYSVGEESVDGLHPNTIVPQPQAWVPPPSHDSQPWTNPMSHGDQAWNQQTVHKQQVWIQHPDLVEQGDPELEDSYNDGSQQQYHFVDNGQQAMYSSDQPVNQYHNGSDFNLVSDGQQFMADGNADIYQQHSPQQQLAMYSQQHQPLMFPPSPQPYNEWTDPRQLEQFTLEAQFDKTSTFCVEEFHVQQLGDPYTNIPAVSGEMFETCPRSLSPYDHSQQPTTSCQVSGRTSGLVDNLLATWPQQKESASLPQPARQTSYRSPTNVIGRNSALDCVVGDGEDGNYQVQYRPPAAAACDVAGAGGDAYSAQKVESTRESLPAADRLQQQFLHSADGAANTWSEKQTQMRVLLDAKGHKIDELTYALNDLKESSGQEIRILKHQLLLVTDERDGLKGSLQQSEQLVQDKQAVVIQLNGQIAALQAEMTALKQNKENMVKKTLTLESMVESLNSQLSELGSSDTLVRAKQQHEAVVAGMRQKFDAEALAANQRIDALTQKLAEKDEQLVSLRKQYAELEKNNKSLMQEHAEEINRLHRSLKESQTSCRELLETQSSQELTRLKLRLQDALASKTLTDDLNTTLQSEIQELREQVRMYEMVSQYSSVTSSGNATTSTTTLGSTSNFDDSYAQLGIRNPSHLAKTASVKSSDSGVMSSDEAVHGLKTELERCLRKCREKSQLATKLQTELKTCKVTLAESTARLDSALKELNTYRQTKNDESLKEAFEKRISAVNKENDSLKLELAEVHRRLVEVAESEAHVTDINVELNQHIAQLMSQRNVTNDDTVVSDRQCLEDECRRLQQQVLELRGHIDEIQSELLATKELYVNVCSNKDSLEDQVRGLQRDVQQHQQLLSMEREKAAMCHNKDVEISEQVVKLQQEHQLRMASVVNEFEAKLAAEKEKLLKSGCKDAELSEQIVQLKQENEHKLAAAVDDFEAKFRAEREQVEKLQEKDVQNNEQLARVRQENDAKMRELMRKHEDTLAEIVNDYEARISAERDKVSRSDGKDEELVEKAMRLKQEYEARMAAVIREYEAKLTAAKREYEDQIAARKEHFDSQLIAKQKQQETEITAARRELETQIAALRNNFASKMTSVRSQHEAEMAAEREKFATQLAAVCNDNEIKLAAREQLFKEKIAVAERDITVLQERLRNSQDELTGLECRHGTHVEELRSQHEQHVSNMARHHEEQLSGLEAKHNEKVAEVSRCYETQISSLRESQQKLTNVKKEMKARLDKLKTEKAELEREVIRWRQLQQRSEMERKSGDEQTRSRVETEKSEVEEKLRLVEVQLQRVESEKCVVRDKCSELEGKVATLSRQLAEANRQFETVLAKSQESMEREHSLVVAALQEKLEEKSAANQRETASARQENTVSVDTMKLMAQELNTQYIAAVEKIKVAVLAHAKDTNQANAALLAQRLVKDRQATARNLRNYYLRCLGKLLDADFDHGYKTQFLRRMERLLDNLPDKDFSNASQCAIPSLQSSCAASPREFLSSEGSTPRNILIGGKPSRPRDVPSLQLVSDAGSSTSSTPRETTAVTTVERRPSGAADRSGLQQTGAISDSFDISRADVTLNSGSGRSNNALPPRHLLTQTWSVSSASNIRADTLLTTNAPTDTRLSASRNCSSRIHSDKSPNGVVARPASTPIIEPRSDSCFVGNSISSGRVRTSSSRHMDIDTNLT